MGGRFYKCYKPANADTVTYKPYSYTYANILSNPNANTYSYTYASILSNPNANAYSYTLYWNYSSQASTYVSIK